MKKFLTAMIVLAVLVLGGAGLVQAQTNNDSALIAQLQAMIVKLQEQLALILSQPAAGPSVQLLYPNGGEVLVTKGTYPVVWSGVNFPAGAVVTLTLKDARGEISDVKTELDNTGNWDWTISEDIEPGTYTLGIFCDKKGVDERCSANSYDWSNGTFKIVDERVNVPTTPSVSVACTDEGLDGSISWSGRASGDGYFWVDISRPGSDSFANNTKTWNRSAEENSIDFRGFTRWDKIGTLALEPETTYLVRVSTGGQFSRAKSFKTPACATALTAITRISSKANDDFVVDAGAEFAIEGLNLLGTGPTKDPIVYFENDGQYRAVVTQWGSTLLRAIAPADLIPGKTYSVYMVFTQGISNKVKVKVRGSASDSLSKETILWPNNGETLEIGKTYVIKWAAENIPANGSITLTLKKTNTTSGENLYIKPELANTGAYWWTIPAGQPTGEYYVGVFCDLVNVAGTCPGDRWDFSDKPIKIVNPAAAPTVNVTANASPQNQVVAQNTKFTIGWTSTNATSCTLSDPENDSSVGVSGERSYSYSRSGTKVFEVSCVGVGGTDVDQITVTVGSAPAPVAGVPAPKITTSCVDQSGSRYQNVAIKWEPAVSGEYRLQEKVIGGSTGYFDFTGGERIQTAGKNYTATRQYSNWGGKTIEYSVSSAAYGTSPVASVTLPQCPASTEPTISLTSPRASQTFTIGQTYEIKWTSANFPANSSVSIALYNENKTAPVAWLIPEHPNTGVATWTVPEGQATGTFYLAAVCDLTTPGGGQCTSGSIDFSDGPVTVARPTSSGAWKQLSGVAESLRSLFR